MPRKYNAFRPRIYKKRRAAGGRTVYVQYWEDGERKFHPCHEGICTCRAKDCAHVEAAEKVLAQFVNEGAIVAGRNPEPVSLAVFWAAWEAAATVSQETVGLYRGAWRLLDQYAHENGIKSTAGLSREAMLTFRKWLRTTQFEMAVHTQESRRVKRKIEYRLRCAKLTRQSPEYSKPPFLEMRSEMEAKMEIRKEPYSEAYIQIVLRSIRAVLFWGVRSRFFDENPLSGAGKPNSEKIIRGFDDQTRNPLTEDEVKRLLSKLKGRDLDMAVVFLYSGLRLGELVHLRWDRLTADGFIRIEPIPEVRWKPKWNKKRRVRIHPQVKEVLDRLRPTAKSQWVFCTRNGGILTESNVSSRFRTLLDRFEVKGEDGTGVEACHGFRHTFATHLLEQNVPLTSVKDILGHADVRTSLIYQHRLDRRIADHVDTFEYGWASIQSPQCSAPDPK